MSLVGAVYTVGFGITRVLLYPFYPIKIHGREHVPEGPVLLCGNHSSMIDPFLVAFAAGHRNRIHFMAKVELFKIPVLGAVLRWLGMFPVDREGGGAMAMKTAMRLLKDGEKVGIFPEGTRVASEEDSQAKAGAVRLAARLGVPLVPVYIPRDKRLFHRASIVVGTPYTIALDKKTATGEDYGRLAGELMDRIRDLKAVAG